MFNVNFTPQNNLDSAKGACFTKYENNWMDIGRLYLKLVTTEVLKYMTPKSHMFTSQSFLNGHAACQYGCSNSKLS